MVKISNRVKVKLLGVIKMIEVIVIIEMIIEKIEKEDIEVEVEKIEITKIIIEKEAMKKILIEIDLGDKMIIEMMIRSKIDTIDPEEMIETETMMIIEKAIEEIDRERIEIRRDLYHPQNHQRSLHLLLVTQDLTHLILINLVI